jgi:predicted nucleic acid-binding protein
VYWLKGNENIEQRALAVGLDEIAISFITLSELYYGAYKSQRVKENLAAVRIIWNKLGFIDSNEDICEAFGKLKAELEKEGKIIDDADLFIAACALIDNLTLVTNNERHFKRIKGLKIENWLK